MSQLNVESLDKREKCEGISSLVALRYKCPKMDKDVILLSHLLLVNG
jgi:hypothetical protein